MSALLHGHHYQARTINQALKKWNYGATQQYIDEIHKEIGIISNPKLSELTELQLDSLKEAIKVNEGFYSDAYPREDDFIKR